MSARKETRARILEAAKGLFAQRGYQASTTRAIAEAAGVNEVTLFRHFKSKAGILRAIAEEMAKRQAGPAARRLPETAGARETLWALARMEIETALREGVLAIRLAFDARSIPEVSEVLGAATQSNLGDLVERIARWQASGELRSDVDASVVAHAFFALTSSYVMYRMLARDGGAERERGLDAPPAEALFDLFWSGVAGEGGGERP